MVEEIAGRENGIDLAHPLAEFGIETDDEAPRADSVLGGEGRDAPRHHAAVEAGRRLHLDDVPERPSVTVEHVGKPRDPILPVFRGKDELLDLPRREAPDRHPLRAESDFIVMEDDGLTVAGLAEVELDGVDSDALGPVEALDRVLPGATRRAPVPHDPGGMRLAPLARTVAQSSIGHETDCISASRDASAASGSGAAVSGRPTTSTSAPARRAAAGVATRFWSKLSLAAGRVPGTTARKPEPHAPLTEATSRGAQTTPSSPHSLARTASRRAIPSGCPAIGRSASERASSDVRSVTATRSRRAPGPAAASRAASSISRPPSAWTVTIAAPERDAAATARPTVVGMSWSFRSRKTRAPVSATSATIEGPSATNASRPTFSQPALSPKRCAAARISGRDAKSSATHSRSSLTPPPPRRRRPPSAGRARRAPRPSRADPRSMQRAPSRVFPKRPDPGSSRSRSARRTRPPQGTRARRRGRRFLRSP